METEAVDGASVALPATKSGYALGPDDGEAIWFNTGLAMLKATAEQTDGRYTVLELRLPKGFASPIHVHHNEDEFFVVVSGEIRVKHADDIVEGVGGSLVYSPRGIAHGFHVDSDEARLLLFFGPAGVEGFFREAATPARWLGLPPDDEPVPDRATLIEMMMRHSQSVVGPPLQPKETTTSSP
jgi:quercetin dioxygenase-like cupin family protein